MLNSYVVSASVTNATVIDLRDPVIITLLHLQPNEVCFFLLPVDVIYEIFLVSSLNLSLKSTLPFLQHNDRVQCVYWNLEMNRKSTFYKSMHGISRNLPFIYLFFCAIDGKGGWDDNGCQVKYSNSTHTSCLCFHLTHFGVLLVSRCCVYSNTY